MVVDSITASNYLLLTGGTLSGPLIFTVASGTMVTTTNLVATNATSTNLSISGSLSLPSNSVTDAMVVDTITASNYLPLSASTSLAYLGFDYPAQATSTFLSLSASTSLPNLIQVGTLANLLFTNATGTNLNITGALSLPSNSVTDAMVADSITASNYLLLTGGTLSGAFGFTTATGTSVTSTNAFFETLAATNFAPANINTTNITTTNFNATGAINLAGSLNFTNATGTNVAITRINPSAGDAGAITIGAAAGTGLITVGNSSANQTLSLGIGTSSTVNIGTGPGTTTIFIGTNSTALGGIQIGAVGVTTTIVGGLTVAGTGATTTNLYVSSLANILKLGVNTSSPIATLAVGGVAEVDPFSVNSSTGSAMLKILANGFAGVGLNVPIATFQAHQPSTAVSRFVLTNSTSGATTNDGLILELNTGASGAFVYNREVGYLEFGTTNIGRMRITSGGLVGIGTSTIASKLTVQGTGAQNPFTILSSSPLTTEMFTILTNGNVGINSSSPQAKLGVEGSLLVLGSASTTNLDVSGLFSFGNANGTSITSTNAFFENLATTNFSPANINTTNITTTNFNATGAITLPSNSVTDAMVVDTITASNYLLLTGGTLSGAFGFTTATGTSVTSTNAYFDNLAAVSLNISASSTFRTSTIAGGFFQADFADCSAEGQTVNYNATSGKFTCLTDGGGTVSSAFTSPVTVSDGTTTSTLTASGIFIATSTANPMGLFFANSTGSVSASGSLRVFGVSTFTTGTFSKNVGIGTTTPTEKLSVVGNISNILSVGNSTSIRQLTTVGVGSNPRAIFVSGNYVYTANTSDGSISIVDISNPTASKQMSSITVGTNPRGIYVSGRYAYVTNNGDNTISIVDISSPTVPVLMSTVAVGTGPQSIVVSGRYAYVSNQGTKTISIVDVSNPKIPVQVGVTNVGMEPFSIAVSGRYAYTANNASNTISVVDVSDPSNPFQTATTSVGANPTGIYVSGRYAYVSHFSSTYMSVVDISSSTAPVQVGTVDVGDTPSSIYVSGRYAYISNQGSNDMSIVDVSSSTSPVQIARIPVGATPFAVTVSGRYAYVANYSDSNVSIIDISGTEVSSLMAHSAEVGNLQSRNDIFAQGNIMAGTGLVVGNGGIMSNGALSIFASSTGATSSVFSVDSGQLSNIFRVFANGNINFGTSTNLYVSSSSTFRTSTITGGFFQTGFTDCNTENDTVNYNATTGKFTCLADAGGVASSVFTTAITVTNGAGGTTSSLRADGLFIATSTTNLDGLFLVNSAGSASASGTLRVFGDSTLTDLTFVSATGTSFAATSLAISASSTFRTSTIDGGFFQTSFGDCSGEGSTVNYNATTGKFTCLVDDGGAGAGGGVNTSTSNYFAVYSGATSVTGTSLMQLVAGTITFTSTTSFANISATSVTSTNLYISSIANLTNGLFTNATSTNLNVSGLTNLASTTITSSTITGGFYQTGLTDCDLETQTVNYDVTTGKFTCLADGGGSGGSTTTWTFSGSNVFLVTSTSKVGIGTSTPAEKLSVVGNISNILDPSSPVSEVSNISVGGSTPINMFVSGKYAYVPAFSSDLLAIIDISDPVNPVLKSTIVTGNEGANPHDVKVVGRYAYVVNWNGASMVVIDVSNPSVPRKVSTTTVGANPRSIAISGRYAYIPNRTDNNLTVVDISNPLAPVRIANTDVGGNPFSIAVSGRYAYVINNGENTMSVVDISNPHAPVQITTLEVGNQPYHVYVSGNRAYTANYAEDSISIIDISNPAVPVKMSSTTVGTGPDNIFVSGRYAYITNEGGTLSIVDISSSTRPIMISNNAIGNAPIGVYVAGRYAYMANSGNATMSVIDISGTEVTSLVAHSAEIGNLQIRNDIFAQGSISVGTSLVVGPGGIFSQGALSVFASSTGATTSVFNVNSAASSTILRVFANGRIGIGTLIATSTLDVQGALEVNLTSPAGATSALCHTTNGTSTNQVIYDCNSTAGADFREMYAADTDLEMGDVVVLSNTFVTTSDGNVIPKLSKSTSTYQTRLVGIISNSSTNSDFNSIGHNVSNEDNPLPLALSGRVLIKVTNINGDIHVGDKLTSSNLPGVAMKATEEGPTIAIAMGDYTSAATGTVMAFVNIGWNGITAGSGVTSTNLYVSGLANLFNATIASVTSTNLSVSGISGLGSLTFTSATGTNLAAVSLNISASSTFRTSTIEGGFFQTSFGDCSGESQTVNYNATTGKFTCLTDDGGAGAGGGVNTSTSNYFAVYSGATSVTGTSFMQISEDAIAFTTNTTFSLTTTVNHLVVTGGCTGCAGTSTFSMFVSSSPGTGTWTAPEGMDYAQVIVTGGGGGGGEAADCSDTACEAAAGGGGAGGTSIEVFTSEEVGSAQTIVVGSGGPGGSTDEGGVGTAGGLSSFGGSLLGAYGGSPGSGADSNGAVHVTGNGGNGGVATTTGDINIEGGDGDSGLAPTEGAKGGDGGTSYWGGGGRGGRAATTNVEAGQNGKAYGSGGGGGAQEDASTSVGADGGRGATGTIMVVSYNSTGGDLAEWYEAKEDVLPGDLVSISSSSLEYESYQLGLSKTSILEKATLGSSVVGVVSAIPYQVMGGDILGASTNAKPIALAGRVPVNVSNENGPVKAGDYLTISSVAGVAMRATKSGVTIGRALQNSECEVGLLCKVMVLVNTSYFNGMAMKKIMAQEGLDLDNIPANLDIGRAMLTKMISDKQSITASSSVAEIFTDRVLAGLEIITPSVIAEHLAVDKLESVSGLGIGLSLADGELFSIFAATTISSTTISSTTPFVSSTPVITFDSLGNGFFAGKLTANEISANEIIGLNVIANQLSVLAGAVDQLNSASSTTSTLVVEGLESASLNVSGIAAFLQGFIATGSSTFVGDVSITGNLKLLKLTVDDIDSPLIGFITSSLGILAQELTNATTTINELAERMVANELLLSTLFTSSTVASSSDVLDASIFAQSQGLQFENIVNFKGGLQVDSVSSISGATTFMSDTIFFGRPYLNSDSGGFVKMSSGTQFAEVIFEREYLAQPVVNASISLEIPTTTDESAETGSFATSTEELENRIFAEDIRYLITKKSPAGFTIKLNKPAPGDIVFSWIALAIKDAKIILSTSTLLSIPTESVEPTSTILEADVPTTTQTSQTPSSTTDADLSVSVPDASPTSTSTEVEGSNIIPNTPSSTQSVADTSTLAEVTEVTSSSEITADTSNEESAPVTTTTTVLPDEAPIEG